MYDPFGAGPSAVGVRTLQLTDRVRGRRLPCELWYPAHRRVAELFERTPESKRMVVLRGADHLHFVDDVEDAHESLRNGTLSGEAAWIPAAMRPLAQLCPPEQAHRLIRGLTLAHLDATLRGDRAAGRVLERAAAG